MPEEVKNLVARVRVVLDEGSVRDASSKLGAGLSQDRIKNAMGDLQNFISKPFQGGVSGIFGKGAEGIVGKLAGLTIIMEGLAQISQKMLGKLTEASPYLKAQLTHFDHAVNMIFRPMGDMIGRMLAPYSKAIMEYARKSDKIVRQAEKDLGPLGGLLVGAGLAIAGFIGPLIVPLFRGIVDTFKGVVDGLAGALDGLANSFQELSNNILKALGIPTSSGGIIPGGSPVNVTLEGGTGLTPRLQPRLFGFAAGGDAIFSQPTMISVGERGAERVSVSPIGAGGQSGGAGGGPMHLTININAPVYGVQDLERTIVDVLDRQAARMRWR